MKLTVVVVWMESPHFIISFEILDKNVVISTWQFTYVTLPLLTLISSENCISIQRWHQYVMPYSKVTVLINL